MRRDLQLLVTSSQHQSIDGVCVVNAQLQCWGTPVMIPSAGHRGRYQSDSAMIRRTLSHMCKMLLGPSGLKNLTDMTGLSQVSQFHIPSPDSKT